MVVDLIASGKRVGVTANSHKVIGELLTKVARAADDRGVSPAIGQRSSDEPTCPDAVHFSNNDEACAGLAAGLFDVVGGTPWLWSSENMVGSIDVLNIDEPGQLSLADTLAAAGSATSLVLLGDPQQLA